MEKSGKYVAFLRGINVGGHHKVPMADLRKELEKHKCKNVITLLNSGNVIFDFASSEVTAIESLVSEKLEKAFGFPIPTLVRNAELLMDLLANNPFANVVVNKDIRLYISFIREDMTVDLSFPWTSEDASFTILEKREKAIMSVLDLSVSGTPKGMEILEKLYGKENITTRNWKTIERIGAKL